MPESPSDISPWEQPQQIIDSDDVDHLEAFLQLLPPTQTTYTISRLAEEHQQKLLSVVRPALAAQLMEHLADSQAADLIEDLPPPTAAAIVDEMASDDQADILGELTNEDAEAILDHMDPQEASDARRLARYEPDTAGGIMISEYVAYRLVQSIGSVLEDLRKNADKYDAYDVQYIYVTDEAARLCGLVRMRDVVLKPADARCGRSWPRIPSTCSPTRRWKTSKTCSTTARSKPSRSWTTASSSWASCAAKPWRKRAANDPNGPCCALEA